jgi:hypothetical protein
MNRLSFKKFLVFTLIFSFAIAVCEAQSFDRPRAPRQQKRTSHKGPIKSKTVKIKGSKSVEKAKNKQAANEKKLKKDYAKFVAENKKHALSIQTSTVKSRMKQNVKDANSSYKAKKKRNTSGTKTGRRKYR